VRQFIKGTNGFAGAFAECLCGSPNLYQVSVCLLLLHYTGILLLDCNSALINLAFLIIPLVCQAGGRKPWHSINFVCAHDGFTLADLVTYNSKYNLANGEDNRDGENHNLSWNCGEVKQITYKHFIFCFRYPKQKRLLYVTKYLTADIDNTIFQFEGKKWNLKYALFFSPLNDQRRGSLQVWE
jgi:hypothetical protein